VKSGKQLALKVRMPDAKNIGRNIRALRMRIHLTQGDLAARLGMLQAPVCNIEGGKNFPSAQVLYRISKVLGVSLDEIFNPSGLLPSALESATDITTPTPCSTSEPSGDGRSFPCEGISQTTTPSLLSEDSPFAIQIRTIIADYLRLEHICKVPREARIPLQIPFDLNAGGITRLASQVRDLMGVRTAVVFDHLELFENHGLRVVFLEMPSPIESLSFYDANNRNVFIFISAQQNPERQIFSLVLELGKILLHVRMTAFGLAYPETLAERWKPARLFAAAFLMPEETVRTTVTQTGILPGTWDFELLLRLKHRFGVSAETFNYRLLELGLITPQLQNKFRTLIKAYYKETNFKEPGSSRRILSPNGRLGDLLHTACSLGSPEASEIARRFKMKKMATGQ